MLNKNRRHTLLMAMVYICASAPHNIEVHEISMCTRVDMESWCCKIVITNKTVHAIEMLLFHICTIMLVLLNAGKNLIKKVFKKTRGGV